jgi:hypothetical protein
MTLLHKIGQMIRHTGQTQMRVAERLAEQKAKHHALLQSIHGLALQYDEIERLLESKKLNDCVIDRAALFALQQRQAVLRQQRYQLDFERDRLREESAELEQQQQQARAEMQMLERKQKKFEHWSATQKRQNTLRRLQREDLEIEDRTVLMR